MFSNASFTTIDNVTLACEINGEKTEETITFSPALAANSMTQHSFKYTADKDYDISYSIAQINGETYSNERFIDKLKDRPTHNFIGRIVGPLSMPISMDRVTFVD